MVKTKFSLFLNLIEYFYSNNEEILHVFPEVNHTFLSADRLFGRIEFEIDNIDSMITADNHNKPSSRYINIKKFPRDFEVFDSEEEFFLAFKKRMKIIAARHLRIIIFVKEI